MNLRYTKEKILLLVENCNNFHYLLSSAFDLSSTILYFDKAL